MLSSLPPLGLYQTWLLPQHYFVLVLLELCDYKGTYVNRLIQSGGTVGGQHRHRPWVSSS